MKKEIVCQENRPPCLYPLAMARNSIKIARSRDGELSISGGEKKRMRKIFVLTSYLKFSINLYIHCPKGFIEHEKVPGDLSPFRQKR